MNEPFIQVSDTVQERYDRALFEFRRASQEFHDAWLALLREGYARAACADARASAETET